MPRTGEKNKETSQTPLFKIPGISALPSTGEENRDRSQTSATDISVSPKQQELPKKSIRKNNKEKKKSQMVPGILSKTTGGAKSWKPVDNLILGG